MFQFEVVLFFVSRRVVAYVSSAEWIHWIHLSGFSWVWKPLSGFTEWIQLSLETSEWIHFTASTQFGNLWVDSLSGFSWVWKPLSGFTLLHPLSLESESVIPAGTWQTPIPNGNVTLLLFSRTASRNPCDINLSVWPDIVSKTLSDPGWYPLSRLVNYHAQHTFYHPEAQLVVLPPPHSLDSSQVLVLKTWIIIINMLLDALSMKLAQISTVFRCFHQHALQKER